MALDNYSVCPCGSGKKFKWCCQPIYGLIEKAFSQDADGQHDAALRTMDELVAAHSSNPEAWGRRAQLLYQNDRVDDAEAALQKALDLNPHYPFGLLLRGKFREAEGEIAGALLQYRKAVDAYDSEAKDLLADLYVTIGDCELKLNRLVAARAALKLAMHLQPASEELRQNFEALFGEKSPFPKVARHDYAFAKLEANAPDARRQAWEQAFASAATGKLSDAAKAHEELTAQDADDAAAWYNLGLTRAWLGDNRGALAALDQYNRLEKDETRAGAAAALAEVLRCGAGMNDEANYIEYSAIYQIRDPAAVSKVLAHWDQERRLLVTQAEEKQAFLGGLVLDKESGLVGGNAPRGIGANMMIIVDHLRLSNVNIDAFQRIQHELEQNAGPGLSPARREERPAAFNSILGEALVFPTDALSPEAAKQKVAENVQHFLEDVWIHRPLRSLGMTPPIDAVGHADLKKKVIGAVQFLDDCAQPREAFNYDFDRLRRRLGIMQGSPSANNKPDIASLGAAELSALDVATLSDQELESAYQSALKLDARDLAAQFARGLIARPAAPNGPDRFPWYSFLSNQALADSKIDEAMDRLHEGEKHDTDHNGGRRRDDYDLRIGQLQAKSGKFGEAVESFERLISRSPSELRFRAAAVESLLSGRQAERALKLAEDGLAEARRQNHRDSEAHFMELVAAAKRQK